MILVTAATAPVGRAIVEQLVAAGTPVRALTRDVENADLPPGADAGGLDLLLPRIVVVVEGAARAVLDGGARWPVELVAAPGSGDDMLVEVAANADGAGDQVVVVTADRGLRVRLDEVGAGWVGPSWLLRRVERA